MNAVAACIVNSMTVLGFSCLSDLALGAFPVAGVEEVPENYDFLEELIGGLNGNCFFNIASQNELFISASFYKVYAKLIQRASL